MHWYTYRHDWNQKKIIKYDVFDNGGFSEAVEKLLKTCKTKAIFGEKIRREVSYYFRSKIEYETAVVPYFDKDRDIELGIDVYDQIMLNFDAFINYIWRTGRKEFKK